MLDDITRQFEKIDDFLYYPVLMIVLIVAGVYFTLRTKGVQIRLFKEACKLIGEKNDDKKKVSSFQALMVSTASRVGTGNIIGVSTAICLGGPGACFWMWIMCIIGAASAFIESTLAQIYKRKDTEGNAYGGPAYYIDKAFHSKKMAKLFCIFLIATYAIGFNLLCSFNLQTSFQTYSFYDEMTTPYIIGFVIALLVGVCLMGGGKRIVKFTSLIVPVMGILYVIVSFIVIGINIKNVPAMFSDIFSDAFDFKAIFGGMAGSCMILGIKRGLYSNEAGVGSAPNASASAHVSHPVKQGLVQTRSVYIDTLVLCTATAFMCLSTGVDRNSAVSGAPYVQNALSSVFGDIGPSFITISMILFAFTTLLGNLYYVDNALVFLNNNIPLSNQFRRVFKFECVAVIFLGSAVSVDIAWAIADITMGGMTLINLPACMILGGVAIKTLKDYEKQKKAKKNPIFKASDIGIDLAEVDFWKDEEASGNTEEAEAESVQVAEE